MIIIKCLYYNWRNLWHYRQEQKVAHYRLMDVAACEDVKRTMTNAFLATVGLKVVDNHEDTVPWYIFLSKTQRNWVRQVSVHGFKVGLT